MAAASGFKIDGKIATKEDAYEALRVGADDNSVLTYLETKQAKITFRASSE